MAASLEEDAKKVLKAIMDSGAFDELKKQMVEELSQDEDLHKYAAELVDRSTVLATCDLPTIDRDKLQEDVLKELQDKLIERASELAWELLSKPEHAVSKDVDNKVHHALCKLYEDRYREAQQAAANEQQQQESQTAQAPQALPTQPSITVKQEEQQPAEAVSAPQTAPHQEPVPAPYAPPHPHHPGHWHGPVAGRHGPPQRPRPPGYGAPHELRPYGGVHKPGGPLHHGGRHDGHGARDAGRHGFGRSGEYGGGPPSYGRGPGWQHPGGRGPPRPYSGRHGGQ